MKKTLLLPAFILFLKVVVLAQTEPNCQVGFASGMTGFYQNFADTVDFRIDSTTGIFPWGDTLQGGPNDPNPHFYAPFKKTPGEITYWVSQGEGELIPFGISFGYTIQGKDTIPNTIDLTNDKTFDLSLTNLSYEMDSTVFFRLAIQDINDSILDTYAGVENYPFETWAYTIQDTLIPQETVNFSGTFEGAYRAHWKYLFDYYEMPRGCAPNPSSIDQVFDFKHVKSVLFTVINLNQDPNSTTCYYSDSLVQLPVAIDYVRLGACPGTMVTGTSKRSSSRFTMSPNPANSFVTVECPDASSNAITVKIANSTGRLVKTMESSSSSTSISVADLQPGFYIVSLEADGIPVSAEKLVVK